MTSSIPNSTPLVLVVDDEPTLRVLATDVLEEDGYRVLDAADAETALRILTERRDIGVLFTDINMPGARDGLDLACEVHRRWPGVKLVVTSGRGPFGRDRMPDDGRFLAKPYSPEVLLREIRSAVAA